MAMDVDYCLKCADAAAREARDASLDNVRDRALRSESAWRAMARRQTAIDEVRRKAAAEKALATVL